jgi:alginate O-acetyltransferase complex protein AlgI
MLFCTKPFLLFFTVVFAVYWLAPWRAARVWWLLAASVFFYAHWNKWLATVVCVSSLIDYAAARVMEATAAPARRRAWLLLSLGTNLGLLVYFKYANFFLRSLEEGLRACGAEASLPVLSVLVPVGISFYTFEAINYTVEVYRRRIPAERNLGHFLLFILFFPHLVAGPIVRAGDFLPQVRRPKRWSWLRAQLGARLILVGLIKKLAVADRMALVADPVFADPAAYGSGALALAALAYAMQVYCDFSGYSDLALGLAHLLGYKLALNFDRPFLAVNIADFWRRWHISLSSWIRDYVFIPLGGSRGGSWRTARNLFVAMVLSGLWHGAGWPYVAFGALQGLLLIGHRAFRQFAGARPRVTATLTSGPGTAARVAATFATFVLTLVVFRCPTLAAGGVMLRRLATFGDGLGLPFEPRAVWVTAWVLALGYALDANNRWLRWLDRLPAPGRGLAFGAALSLALVLAPDASKAFIYFQF